VEDTPIEALSWRLACVAPGRDIRISRDAPKGAAAAQRGTRDVLFDGVGTVSCAVYDRYALAPGATFDGPALVEERAATCCSHGPRRKSRRQEVSHPRTRPAVSVCDRLWHGVITGPA